MQLEKLPNETDLAYHKRLIDGKLVDKTLADCDYSELSQYVYGKEYASDVARRMMYGSKRTLDLLEAQNDSRLDSCQLEEIEQKRIELQKERQKFFDYRNAFNKAVRDRSRAEELNEIITAAVTSGDLPELKYSGMLCQIAAENDLVVSLNDIHYGACVDNYWRKYNSDICREMFDEYLSKIISIAELHNSENCYVMCNGDAISGLIHYSIAVTNKENVIEQVVGVSELISEFLAELSNHFNKVIFLSVSGNHSRLNQNKDETLVGERLDDLIEWYVKARLQNFKNVEVMSEARIDSTMFVVDIRGKTYVGVHGDFDSSPSKIQTLQAMVGKPLCAVFSGHMHHNAVNTVQNIKTVMSGSFMGTDEFCVQKRIFGRPEQIVCVCDKTGIVCYYDIDF